ncbi:dihydropteroate synthase [Parabacteroides sp. FAFU027]|uniref:dihydropteroate synthase n=1 Tax=Parabacteroides sp. FAFU027 TaxID=2922715 RepID=UPI001FAF19C2|nr:dihydropteroate synthase [Parabacteroides sp. FAFU027]
MKLSYHQINLNGTLYDLSTPVVMGILNVTPDSFYGGSRYQTEKDIAERTEQILAEGALMIDLGAYSSRPDGVDISPEEEMERLDFALKIIQKTAPEALISVDTFRASVAERCVKEYGVSVINDISGGIIDDKMFETVADLHVPYVLMHMRGVPQTMQQFCQYDNLLPDILFDLAKKVEQLRKLGVCDIIIDPGFGFSKTLDQNYELMHHLREFGIFDLPLLVGISRKSMIYKFLGGSPETSLNGTIVLNTLALLGGASILRVHDVKEAVETIKLVQKVGV